jgi:hypothetical protein
VTRGLARLRDRPASVDERRAAVLAVLAVILSTVALLGVAHDPSFRRPRSSVRTLDATLTAPATTPTVPIFAVLRVVHGFLPGYLAYAYRGAPAANVSDATPALIASLEDHPPRVAPLHASAPRVIEMRLSGPLRVTAVLNDGGIVNYTLGLALTRLDRRLVVARLESE